MLTFDVTSLFFIFLFSSLYLNIVLPFVGAWGSVVVKALRYKSMGPGIDPRWFH